MNFCQFGDLVVRPATVLQLRTGEARSRDGRRLSVAECCLSRLDCPFFPFLESTESTVSSQDLPAAFAGLVRLRN